MEKPKRGTRKWSLLAVFNEQDLSPIGIFLNTVHIQSALGLDPGNLTKYLNEEFSYPGGPYVVVRVERDGKEPLDTEKLLSKAQPIAEIRKTKSVLAKLTSDNIKNLSPDKIKAIQEILNK